MNAQLGVILVFLALISSTYAFIASLIGARRDNDQLVESARNAAIVTWPLLTAACVILISLLVRGNFNTSFVWEVTDRSMPTYLKMTALWGGQSGSLLFWSWLMSTFAAIAMMRNWEREHYLMPYVIAAASGTLTFFVALVAIWENPFASFWQTPGGEIAAYLFGPSGFFGSVSSGWANLASRVPGLLGVLFQGMLPLTPPVGSMPVTPPDGNGLNPLLRHPGMIIHPPMLYLGFVGFVIPFSFGIAALARGEISDSWIRATRRWTLIAWLFLSLGLILGGWWAYDVLGWGGYWAWDPVENAALMPWLTGTAFLHSVMIQEKRGMLRRWNMVLITLTYLQVVLGTFATRSGFVSSVHSFAQSAIGPLFFIFFGIGFVGSAALLMIHWDDLKADNQLDSLLSRETLFLVNNFLFLSLNVVVALGTYWPVFTELLSEVRSLNVERSSLGAEWYDHTTAPLWIALVLLMGVVPLVAWKRTSIKRFGRAMLWPLGLTVVFTISLFVFGVVGAIGALAAYAVLFMTATTTLLEYHRGAAARVQAHGENYFKALWVLAGRNRRRYGGYLIHIGVVVMAVGVISSHVFQLETQRQLSPGQTITVRDYVLEFDTLERFIATDGRSVIQAQTTVYRNGREVGKLVPRIDNYPSGQPMSIPGKYTSLGGDDFYVLLVTWEEIDFSKATFKIYHNPLINWVWGGGFIFIAGALIAAWPDFSEERRTATRPVSRASSPAMGK